jgi:exodeoxyribonuclease-5
MILTINQVKGLKTAVTRYKAGEKYTIISGYAGSGKSTLVRFIIDALDVKEEDVCYCAFTGKATEVLRKKGNKNVKTLHKLLYKSVPKPDGGFIRKPVPSIEYKIIVVDEVSMAPKTMMDLLFKYDVYVICLGDPFQLPPVSDGEDNQLLSSPHVFLDEIMRQAQESEIIRLSMKIRNQEPIEYFCGKEARIIPYSEANTGLLQWGDQILTATNAKRQAVNNQMRALEGRDGAPTDGDKVICLRNYWDDFSENENALINGTIGILSNTYKTWRDIPRFIKGAPHSLDVLAGDLILPGEDDVYKNLEMDYNMFLTGKKCVDWKLSYRLSKLKYKYGEIVPKEFDFAYAVTYWKSQGSEWDKVVVLEESFPFDRETHAKALYTAVTRSSEKLVWVR